MSLADEKLTSSWKGQREGDRLTVVRPTVPRRLACVRVYVQGLHEVSMLILLI